MASARGCLRAAQTLSVLGLLAFRVHADRLLPVNYLPEGISSSCATALSADIACPGQVATLQSGLYYSQTNLRDVCTTGCAAALSSYHGNVVSSCASDTWVGPGDEEQPVAMISETFRYHYNFTCLTDNGRFCNNVAAAFAAAANSKPGDDAYDLPAGGDFGEHDTSDRCDACLLKNLAFQAGSPYYDGPRLQSMSLYESRTSSCGIATAPLTTTPNSLLPYVRLAVLQQALVLTIGVSDQRPGPLLRFPHVQGRHIPSRQEMIATPSLSPKGSELLGCSPITTF